MVHQDYRLVPFLSVVENLVLAAELRGLRGAASRVESALGRVGLDLSLRDRPPMTLSGGEQQRLAIARALLCDVKVLLADEPTGALDVRNTMQVADLLSELGDSDGMTVMVATHDPSVADRFSVTYTLTEGRLSAQ